MRILRRPRRSALWIIAGLSALMYLVWSQNAEFSSRTEPHRREQPLLELQADKAMTSPNVTKVLLVTYFRGGSTFLGELFNQNPAVFYAFEPLMVPFDDVMFRNVTFGVHASYILKSMRRVQLTEERVESLLDPLLQMFNCDLGDLDTRITSHHFFTTLNKSRSFRLYGECFRIDGMENLTDAQKVSECLPLPVSLCRNQNIRVVKTIRISGYLLERLLAIDPSIKVIYYTRDPRAVLVSRAKVSRLDLHLAKTQFLQWASRGMCMRMEEDLAVINRLSEKYLIKRVRFEDLATDTHQVAREMYDFLGVPLPEVIHKWIEENTHATTNNGMMGTKRNSSQVVSSWRELLPARSDAVITRQCQGVLEELGYN